MRFCSTAFLTRVAAACARNGVWLIADEVFTGFGRLGTMFACEQAGVVPDIVCLSKGITGGTLALGATAVRPHVFESFLGDAKSEAFLHGHSYTGSPIACAAAVASLGLFAEEGTLARVAAIEAAYRSRFAALEAIPQVSGVRAWGSVFAYEVNGGPGGYYDPIGRRICDRAFAEGLYVRPLGNTLYLVPPLCVTPAEIGHAVDVLIAATVAELRG